jgi:hypothetical protein
MQRAQSDDVYQHASLCSYPLIPDRGGQMPPAGYSCTKAVKRHGKASAEEGVMKRQLSFAGIVAVLFWILYTSAGMLTTARAQAPSGGAAPAAAPAPPPAPVQPWGLPPLPAGIGPVEKFADISGTPQGRFLEGGAFDTQGNLWFVAIGSGWISYLTPEGRLVPVVNCNPPAALGQTCEPQGTRWHDGKLYLTTRHLGNPDL